MAEAQHSSVVYQIRDDHFGNALYEARNARVALANFAADWARWDALAKIVIEPDGSATCDVNGVTFRAIPTERKSA